MPEFRPALTTAALRRLIILLSFVTLLGGSGTAGAQVLEDLALSVAPNPATTEEPLVATVTGVASCPHVADPVIGDGIVEIRVSGFCPILPPSPGLFTEHSLVGTLTAGLWQIQLINDDLDIVVETVTVSVTDPTYQVSVSPSPAREGEEISVQMTGIDACISAREPEISEGKIRVTITQSFCTPPVPAPFEFTQSLGQLPVGEYLVEMYRIDFNFVETRVAETTLRVETATGCSPDDTTLCLNQGRFQVRAAWNQQTAGASAHAVPETDDSGLFWFFDSQNIEMVVKVLNGCDSNFNSYWVFAAGLTDVGVELEVTDTLNDEIVNYENLDGHRFETITDTAAFATCP